MMGPAASRCGRESVYAILGPDTLANAATAPPVWTFASSAPLRRSVRPPRSWPMYCGVHVEGSTLIN